jgi:uncharacterized membrane-anchored protein
MKLRSFSVCLLLVLPVTALAQQQPSAPMTQEQRTDAIRSLGWLPQGTYKLPISNSTLALPNGYHLVLGDDARRLTILTGDPSGNSIEAAAFTQSYDNEVLFQSINDGYVTVDDWKDVDPDEMIKSIRENTEEANKTRKQQGEQQIHVVGWLQQPTLDRQTNTVYWAIEGVNDDGSRVANSIALRLGRNGYERLNWITDRANYVPLSGQLDVMLRAHSFDPGSRYADHVPGDRVAAYTIVGLVAAVAGAKVLKVAAGVGALVLLKKFGVVIFVALAAGLARLRRFFRRGPNVDVAPPTV